MKLLSWALRRTSVWYRLITALTIAGLALGMMEPLLATRSVWAQSKTPVPSASPSASTTPTLPPSASFTYDGDGKRLAKQVGGVTHSYFYDVNRALPVVLEDSFTRNVWGHDLAYAIDIRLLSGASRQGGREPAPEALATSPGDVLVYHKDGLGSVRAITDTAGNVIETYETDEFGIVTGASGSVEQPFGYTGEIRDAETGLVYLRARYYDPEVGRFISRDTEMGDLTHPLSMNRYTYALDNPLSYVDPSGHTNIHDPMGGGGRGQVGGFPMAMGGEVGGLTGGAAGRSSVRIGTGATSFRYSPQQPIQTEKHHIASDKAVKSGFTKRFEEIFAKAGMTLGDKANTVHLPGHYGPHAKAYHRYVLTRLTNATEGLSGAEYKKTLAMNWDCLGGSCSGIRALHKGQVCHDELVLGSGL